MNNRRRFLTSTAMAPLFVPGGALGLNGAVAASNRITIATIGCGGMGTGHINAFSKLPEAQYVAICDLDEEALTKAKELLASKYNNPGVATYRAFEEVLSRRDIDAVTMATPDHWHGIVATTALRAGKDVYGEKPLAHNFHEGLKIVEAVKRNNRIWQTGSWQRSVANFFKGCSLVRNGRIGKVTRIEVGLPSGPFDYGKLADKMAFVEPPRTLNYDRWLGPAPEVPYWEGRTHWNWRWNLDYGGGQLMDWIGHHCDIAHWGMGWDDVGPYEVEGTGEYPAPTELWNSARRYRVTAKYSGGVEMVIAGGHKDIRSGTKWIGDKGWIWVDRGGRENKGIEAQPASLLDSVIGPNEIQLVKSDNHYAQFLACVKSRQETLTPARVAHRSATPGWLGQIAMLTGRKIRWDPARQCILNDDGASAMLSRDMRSPYRL